MCLVKMDDLSGIVDDLRKKYCGLSGEVCYNERRQWALREYCRKENRMNQVNYQKELEKILYIIFDYSHKHYTFKQFEV